MNSNKLRNYELGPSVRLLMSAPLFFSWSFPFLFPFLQLSLVYISHHFSSPRIHSIFARASLSHQLRVRPTQMGSKPCVNVLQMP